MFFTVTSYRNNGNSDRSKKADFETIEDAIKEALQRVRNNAKVISSVFSYECKGGNPTLIHWYGYNTKGFLFDYVEQKEVNQGA